MKQLKNDLSAYLRRVAQGEQVRVTMRGRPVADLVPPATDGEPDRIDALIAAGRITPASTPKPSKPPPLAPPGPGPTLSEIILAEREEDR